jgi:hypothetical protein
MEAAAAVEFHVLSHHELQALCKRNDVRANMTNAAMADALQNLTSTSVSILDPFPVHFDESCSCQIVVHLWGALAWDEMAFDFGRFWLGSGRRDRHHSLPPDVGAVGDEVSGRGGGAAREPAPPRPSHVGDVTRGHRDECRGV